MGSSSIGWCGMTSAERQAAAHVLDDDMFAGPYCLLPSDTVGFPRYLLPIQTARRSVPLLLTLAAIVVLVGAAFDDLRLATWPPSAIVGLVILLGWARVMLPKAVVVSGPHRHAVLAMIVVELERPVWGFRMIKSQTEDTWRYGGIDFYPWDPSFYMTHTHDATTVTGPGVAMAVLVRRLVCR